MEVAEGMRFVAAGLCPVQRIDRSSRVYLLPGSAEMGGLNVYRRNSRTQSYSITRSHSKDRRIRNTPPHHELIEKGPSPSASLYSESSDMLFSDE